MYRALVADDEPMILDGIDSLISWEEFGIEIAAKVENGREALSILLEQPIDILITDIRMPVMTGLELLRELRKNGKHTKTIVLSGYDDFHYVKEANLYGIENYLLKPVEEKELEETLLHLIERLESEQRQQRQMQESYRLLRDNILCRWLEGTISREEWEARAEFLELPGSGEAYQVCVLKPRSPVSQSIHERLEAELSGWGLGAPMVFSSLSGDLIRILFRAESKSGQMSAKERFQKGIARLERMAGTSFLAAVGPPASGWEGVPESCREAERLLDYGLVLPFDSVLSPELIGVQAHPSLKKIDWPRLSECIRKMDASGFEAYCRSFFSEAAAHSAPNEIRFLACEMLFFLSRNSDRGQAAFRWESFQKVLRAVDLNALLLGLRECAETAMQRSAELSESTSPVIAAVLRDVHENYEQELSLKSLAQKYKINAAYLGQLFKNETGELVSAYLCRLRIDKAMELLRSTDWKTNRIAEKTGFSNTNYFSNTFKKVTGMYPSEFRAVSAQLSPGAGN